MAEVVTEDEFQQRLGFKQYFIFSINSQKHQINIEVYLCLHVMPLVHSEQ